MLAAGRNLYVRSWHEDENVTLFPRVVYVPPPPPHWFSCRDATIG